MGRVLNRLIRLYICAFNKLELYEYVATKSPRNKDSDVKADKNTIEQQDYFL